MKKDQEHFRGCLFGGAIGDALGRPVERLRYDAIVEQYGPQGIRDLECGPDGSALFTDDTQLTLFTAEGLLRAAARNAGQGLDQEAPAVVYNAYLRWLHTQGYPQQRKRGQIYDGWLLQIAELHSPIGPGKTCLSALAGGQMGTIDKPINDSSGCGGVMRVAPVGLFCSPEQAFPMGCQLAALTHSHPNGYLPAGVFAHIVALLVAGWELMDAVADALCVLTRYPAHAACLQKLQQALELAQRDMGPVAAISTLGAGWVGDEALAIALYCALRHSDDWCQAVLVAVNHGGDSDSTGAITGNILGVYHGLSAIPAEWIAAIQLPAVLQQVADDLLLGYQPGAAWSQKYPAH